MKNRNELSSSSNRNSSNSSSTNSNPLSTVLSAMNGNAITNGWDAVCAINIDKANELFFQRFTNIFGSDNNSLVLPTISRAGTDNTVIFNNVTLSQPLIQINTNIAADQVLLSFILLAGTITTTSATNPNSIGSVVNITPSLNLQFTSVVNINVTSATTDTARVVSFDVSEASFNFNTDSSTVYWDQATQSTISQLLTTAVQQSTFPNDFPIATLPSNTSGDLMPTGTVKFAVQQDSNNSNDAGRLLVFMPTSFNPNGGTQTSLNVANIVPDSVPDSNGTSIPVDNALIISANVFSSTFETNFIEALNSYNITFSSTTTNNLPSLTSSTGTFTTTTVPTCWTSPDPINPYGQDNNIAWCDLSIPLTNGALSFFYTSGNYQIGFNSTSTQSFTAYVNSSSNCVISEGLTPMSVTYPTLTDTLTISGGATIEAEIVNNSTTNCKEISFTLSNNINSNIGFYMSNFQKFEDFGSSISEVRNDVSNNIGKKISSTIINAITSGMPSINTFVLENFLFSTNSTTDTSGYIQMQAAYLPGDIAIFGTTQMPNWYLSASNVTQDLPISVVQARSSITLSTIGTGIPQGVSWTNPSLGTLSSESSEGATYTAPTTVTTAQVVTIDASDTSNTSSTTSYPIMIIPNTLLINPNFAVIQASYTGPNFAVTIPSGDSIGWTSSNTGADITFSPTDSVTPKVISGNYTSTQFSTITATDNTSSIVGSSYVLTIPNPVGSEIGMQNIAILGAPGASITINALSGANVNPPVTTIASWQQFDENNPSGLTLQGAGMSNSFTIDSNATPGSVIFIVASIYNVSNPSAIAAVVVTESSSSSDYNYYDHYNDVDLSGTNMFDMC